MRMRDGVALERCVWAPQGFRGGDQGGAFLVQVSPKAKTSPSLAGPSPRQLLGTSYARAEPLFFIKTG